MRVPAGPVTHRLPAVRRAAAPWVLPAALLLVTVPAGVVRLQGLGTLGLSTDEAVYVGQGRALLAGGLPEVRAHPPLFGVVLRLVPDGTTGEVGPRAVAVALGLVAVVVAGLLGRELAGWTAGGIAALAVATMPYHADVTRLALVEVPMATAVAVALLLAVRSVTRARPRLVEVAAAVLGVATLFKETAALSAAALAVAALAGALPVGRRVLVRSAGWYVLVVSAYPAYLAATGGTARAVEYVGWQLARTTSSGPGYLDVVLPRVGWGVLVAAAIGAAVALASRRPEGVVVVLAVAVPAVFYAVWPTSSYPYLLALVVPLAGLSGSGVRAVLRTVRARSGSARTTAAVAGTVALVLGVAAPATGGTPQLPGASGVPALRETAGWLSSVAGAPVVTAAPWVATVVSAYLPGRGVATRRPAGGERARQNPAQRDTRVEGVPGGPTWVVWDAWTASRDPVTTAALLGEVRSRGGLVQHVETRGAVVGAQPLVVVYRVGPRTGGRDR